MKLNLGCNDDIRDGYINIDCYPVEGKDITIMDLTKGIALPDNSVDEIIAYDVIEHLPDKIKTMNELWRVLKPKGQVDIIVPTTDGKGAWQDPTHVSFWNRNSFFYFTKGDEHFTRFKKGNGIIGGFSVVNEQEQRIANFVAKLRIVLRKEID